MMSPMTVISPYSLPATAPSGIASLTKSEYVFPSRSLRQILNSPAPFVVVENPTYFTLAGCPLRHCIRADCDKVGLCPYPTSMLPFFHEIQKVRYSSLDKIFGVVVVTNFCPLREMKLWLPLFCSRILKDRGEFGASARIITTSDLAQTEKLKQVR